MNMHKYFLLSIFFYLLIENGAFSQPLENHDGLKHMLQDKWIEYLQSLATVEGEIHAQYKNNGKIFEDFNYYYVSMYPFFAESAGSLDSTTEVSVTGKKYHFRLKRPSIEQEWSIVELQSELAKKQVKDLMFPAFHEKSWLVDSVGYRLFNRFGVGMSGVEPNKNLYNYFFSEWVQIEDIK